MFAAYTTGSEVTRIPGHRESNPLPGQADLANGYRIWLYTQTLRHFDPFIGHFWHIFRVIVTFKSLGTPKTLNYLRNGAGFVSPA